MKNQDPAHIPNPHRSHPSRLAPLALLLGALTCLPATGPLHAETVDAAEKPLDVTVTLNQDKLVGGQEQDVILKIDLVAGKPKRGGVRLPLNVAVVMDRSGSMEGAKLEQARQAAAMLVDRLEPDDVFALVTYDSDVEVPIPAGKVGDDAERYQRIIRRIESGGSTALYSGVQEGGEQVREYLKSKRINRVLLLSDGLANVGPKSPREITRLGKDLADEGIGVTTIGLGADFNEDLMTALAEASDANYYFVEDVETLPGIFSEELGQLSNIVARDVEIHIILPEGVTPIGIMGRTEKFEGREATIRLSQFNAAQRRELLVRARLTPGGDRGVVALATINGRYVDELAEGREGKFTANAKAEVTEDVKLAERSRNSEVIVRVQQVETDEAKAKAADLAVAGKPGEAQAVLSRQVEVNTLVMEKLPPAAAAPLATENSGLNQYSKDFEDQEGESLRNSAKRAKAESWNRRNSKMSR